jgi:hypothetical protein
MEKDKDNESWWLAKTYNNIPLIVGNAYNVNNEFWTYVGDFKSKEEVPNAACCYTIGDEFKIRRSIPNTFAPKPKDKRKRNDDDRPIDTSIKDTDNTLMILIKTALLHKNITRGDFKASYTNVSDMNNALRCIENGENLSWARFIDLCQRFHIVYNLSIFDDNVDKEILKVGGYQ